MRLVFVALLLTTVSPLPPSQVPGEADPTLTRAVICDPNFHTSTIRPPASFTNALKRKQMAEFKLPGRPSDYEEDHLIPLDLGGAPRSPKNLWPQTRHGVWNAAKKDRLEALLPRLVCSGKLDQKVAQQAIASDWVAAYKKYVGGK